MTKFCVDCRHCITEGKESTYYRCDVNARADLVTGNKINFFCSVMRTTNLDGYCGEEGRFWESNTIPESELDLAFPPQAREQR